MKLLPAPFFIEHILCLLLKEISQKETLRNENVGHTNYSGILRTGATELNPVQHYGVGFPQNESYRIFIVRDL